MFRGVKEWLKYFLWPSLPYQVLEVVFPDRVETYYEGYDEITIHSTKRGYVITIVPRESRDEAPGPISFVSSHDPWTVGALVTPFYIYRQLVILWSIVWFFIAYFVFAYGFNTIFTPPTMTIYIPRFGRNVTIYDPTWQPDPVAIALWIVTFGFIAMYFVYNILRFITPSVKYSTLIIIGSVSGVYYAIPGPEPLTTIKVPDFLRLLGEKMRHFELELVHALVGALTSVRKENKVLREQALSYDDAMSRVSQIDQMYKRFSATQVVSRLMITKPLLFMLLITIPLVVGVFIGLALGGGVSVEPATNTTATP